MKQTKFLIARCLTLLVLALLSTNLAWGADAIITFANQTSGTSDSNTAYSPSDFVSKGIASNDQAFGTITCSETSNCFSGKIGYGLKAGGSSKAGSFTISFTALSNVTKITLNAASYSASNKSCNITLKTGDTQIGNKYTTSSSSAEFANAEFTPTSTITSLSALTVNTSKYCYIKSITITYSAGPSKTLKSIAISGTPTKTTYYDGEEFDPAGLVVTGTYDDASTAEITSGITWNVTPSGALTAGTTSVSVTAKVGGVESSEYTVDDITVRTIANTQETAYTVEEAKAIIDANPAALSTTNVYVKGTVSKVDKYDDTYKSITYWLDNNAFEVYSGKNLNNTDFASKDDVTVGDDVVVYGIIKKFNSTYEFDKNNYLVSHVKASTLEIDNITVSLGGTISPEITTNVTGEYTITYSVPSEDVVKVEGGNLVTVAVGGPVTVTATLTAEGYKDATTTFTVEVIKALTSIVVKTAPTTTSYKAGDKFDPTGLVITATYNDETTEDIAYSDETKDSFTFDPSLVTALTTENTSVTITYAGKEATQTISVRPLSAYHITWMANGIQFGDVISVVEGNPITLPKTNPESIGDFVFRGWTATEKYYDAETAPEYITNETVPTGNTTYYAVYAKATSEFQEKDVTYTFTSKAWADATSSWTSGKDGNEYTKNQGVQVTSGVTGANATSNSEFTEITKVVVNYCTNAKAGKGTISVKVGEGTAQSYSVSAPSSGGQTLRNTDDMIFGNETGKVNITVGCETNSIYINSITITSKVGEETISNYTTSVASANMAITAAKWGTFCAPFAVTIPDGVKAYTADASGSEVTFAEVKTTIPAGKPVVVYSATEVNQNFTGDATVNTNDCTSGVLKGVYTATSGITAETGYTNYVLQNHDGVVGFYKATSTISLKANRCYMTLATSAGAKDCIGLDGAVTGISEILNPTKKSVEGIFDLNGRKLAAPQKGINIINGVKVIVK